jgi:hypothetical protein
LIDCIKINSVDRDKNDPTRLLIKATVLAPPPYISANFTLKKNKIMTKLKDHERAVLSAIMFDNGMVPINNPTDDIGRALSSLPKDDARAMKRKFRKQWRKLARHEARRLNVKKPEVLLANRFGMSKSNPSRQDRLARKQLVQQHFYEKLVRPILDQFEFGGENGPQLPGKNQE